jgi:predicted DNA-binding transcriptional regulator YafY
MADTSHSLFEIIRGALWEDFELRVTYYSELGSYAGTMASVLRPLGLVAAAGDWFLVAERHQHVIAFPLATILAVEVTNDHFERPGDFQLDSFWQSRLALRRRQQPAFICEVIISDSAAPLVGDALLEQHEQIDETRSRATLQFDTFERARSVILSLGNAVELLAPLALRLSIIDFAHQTAAVYDSE